MTPQKRKKVLQVCLDLTKDDSLIKCMTRKTQNPNEAFHSKICGHMNNFRYFGLKTVTHSVHYTIVLHNVGYVKADLTKELGLDGMSTSMK